MKNKEKLRELSERIREKVPSLKELTRGCAIYVPDNDESYILGTSCQTGRSKSKKPYPILRINNGISSQSGTTVLLALDRCVIIGHPIGLEDVLEAYSKLSNGYFFTQNGDVPNEEYSIRKKTLRFIWSWEYGKPLSQQKPEVIDALHSIFFKTK